MTRSTFTGGRYGAYLIVLVILLTGLLLFAPLSTLTAEEGAATFSDDELVELVQTLEDSAERERFVGDLKSLLAARQALDTHYNSASAGASAMINISDGLDRVGNELVGFFKGLANIPEAARWLGDEWAEGESRDLWAEMVWKLAVVIGGGSIAALVVSLGLRRPRRVLASRPRPKAWLRPFVLLGYNLMHVVPVLAFAGAGYG